MTASEYLYWAPCRRISHLRLHAHTHTHTHTHAHTHTHMYCTYVPLPVCQYKLYVHTVCIYVPYLCVGMHAFMCIHCMCANTVCTSYCLPVTPSQWHQWILKLLRYAFCRLHCAREHLNHLSLLLLLLRP